MLQYAQVEILGVSLPWKSIFCHEDVGVRFCEHIDSHRKGANSLHSKTEANPFASQVMNDNGLPSIQSVSSTNSFVDFLTGEIGFSDSISQPIGETIVHEGSDLLDFLDDPLDHPVSDTINDSKVIPTKEGSDDGSQQYIRSFKVLAGPHWVRFQA